MTMSGNDRVTVRIGALATSHTQPSWVGHALAALIATCCSLTLLPRTSAADATESYRPVPLPAGVHVVATELDGPVFAERSGKTLYQWPLQPMRSGVTGDHLGTSECTDVKIEVSAGLMSPYPAGLRLPEVDKRLSCSQAWPPFLASPSAKPVGKWSIINRKDGARQWAYEDLPVYTFHLDQRPGDVLGGRADRLILDAPAVRRPGWTTSRYALRVLRQDDEYGTTAGHLAGVVGVYLRSRHRSRPNCDSTCQETWIPLLAPSLSQAHGEWSVIERSAGIRQWAFRGKPLYRYALDSGAHRFTGSDVPGWHNVYTQRAPNPPAEFTVQETTAGQVLADREGRTLYTYFCGDDGVDQLGCDHPDETQVYRLAICGGGDGRIAWNRFPMSPHRPMHAPQAVPGPSSA